VHLLMGGSRDVLQTSFFSFRDIHIFQYTCIPTSLLSQKYIHLYLYTLISVLSTINSTMSHHLISGPCGLNHITCLVKSDPHGLVYIPCLVKKRPGMGWREKQSLDISMLSDLGRDGAMDSQMAKRPQSTVFSACSFFILSR
jgi:hypothetical protein